MKTKLFSQGLLLLGLGLPATGALAAEEPYALAIRDHQFVPSEIEIPAGKKIKLIVANEDSTPEEFESRSLKREKIIPGKSRVTLSIGPLDPGSYEFFGEFHEATAKGRLIAK